MISPISMSSRIVLVGVLTLAMGCSKSKPKNTGASGSSSGGDSTYVITLVLPKPASSLALIDGQGSTVSFVAFDAEGSEISTGSLQTISDNGVSFAELRASPQNIYAIDGGAFGAVVSPTGDAPGPNIQVAMTLAGKNVAEAIKAVPKDLRSSIDVAAAELLLPAGTKFDYVGMKDLFAALAEQGKSIPSERRMQLNLQRAKTQIDYIDVLRNAGDLEIAVASASAAASKIFISANPDLADNPIVKLVHRPADALTSNTALMAHVPTVIKTQVMTQALTRQVVSAIVANNDGKPFAATDLRGVATTLENIKTHYSAARALSDDFESKFIETVKTESFGTDGRPKSFDPARFSSLVMGSVEKSAGSGNDFSAFKTNLDRYNSTTPGCVKWRKKCTAEGLVSPQKIAGVLQNGARTLIDQLAKLPTTDKAILSCSAVATSQVILTAKACADGDCLASTPGEVYTQGAKAACAINSCLKSFIKNAATEAMSIACDAGNKLAVAIECNGLPEIGGGLGGLCDTEIANSKPPELKECPYSPQAPACTSNGGPKSTAEIHTACVNEVQGYSSDADFSLFQGNCLAKCESLTATAAKGCEPAPPPPASFCAVGAAVMGGFTYSNLTVSQCRSMGLDSSCSGDDNSPCRCGHPLSANSCTEYYQQTQVNSLPGELLPVAQDLCPDDLLEAAKQITNSTDCASFSASNPSFSIRWIQN